MDIWSYYYCVHVSRSTTTHFCHFCTPCFGLKTDQSKFPLIQEIIFNFFLVGYGNVKFPVNISYHYILLTFLSNSSGSITLLLSLVRSHRSSLNFCNTKYSTIFSWSVNGYYSYCFVI